MNPTRTAYRRPLATRVAIPGRRLPDRIRFVAGLAISAGGAAVMLADLLGYVAARV